MANRKAKRRAAALMDALLSRLGEAEAYASRERRPDLHRAIARVRRIRGQLDGGDGAVPVESWELLRQVMEVALDLLIGDE